MESRRYLEIRIKNGKYVEIIVLTKYLREVIEMLEKGELHEITHNYDIMLTGIYQCKDDNVYYRIKIGRKIGLPRYFLIEATKCYTKISFSRDVPFEELISYLEMIIDFFSDL